MNDFWAVIYGLIQGVTEFLPISSSGHLALIPFFAHFEDPGLIFDLAMHIGTALAVAVYFYKDVIKLVKGSIQTLTFRGVDYYALNFMIATFFTGIGGILLKDVAETHGRHHLFIAFNLFFFGILLFLADRSDQSEEGVMKQQSGWKYAAVIGVTQILAIFPGVSRSGITITSARFFKLSRTESSSYSFLLSLPLIIGGAILKFIELTKKDQVNFDFSLCFIGVFVAFFVGVVTIHYFLKLLKRIKFSYFMIYRALLAAVIVFLSF
jgi:undecaprenyl-diphosphatase